MTQAAQGRPTLSTGARVTTLIVLWLAVVYLAAPRLGLYYETLAAWYTVPPIGMIYAYCLSHRLRATAILAVVATVIGVFLIGFAFVIPKGSAV